MGSRLRSALGALVLALAAALTTAGAANPPAVVAPLAEPGVHVEAAEDAAHPVALFAGETVVTATARPEAGFELWLFGNASWLEGEVDTFPALDATPVREPMDRAVDGRRAAGPPVEPRRGGHAAHPADEEYRVHWLGDQRPRAQPRRGEGLPVLRRGER
jgi:hypothetical protein